MEDFQRQVHLSEDPYKMQVRMAKATGAYETYEYLLSMTEEDLNHE